MVSSRFSKNEGAMTYPPPLSVGDCIGLAAPASPVSEKERDACVQVLKELGFRVQLTRGLREIGRRAGDRGRGAKAVPYLAGDARERAQELNQMFWDRRIQAIFCVRGGYGSAGILPFLDYRGIRRNPKIFVGYSDLTAVHMALQRQCGLMTFHGPMVKSNLILPEPAVLAKAPQKGRRAYEWEGLWRMIGQEGELAFEGRARFENPGGEEIRVLGGEGAKRVEGALCGGNLSVLLKLAGTGYLPDLRGKILFLEDVGESAARIHMGLIQMEQMGIFNRIHGLLLGDFTDCGPGVEEMLEYFFRDRQLTVLQNICSDHRQGMGTLPLGAWCQVFPAKRRILLCR